MSRTVTMTESMPFATTLGLEVIQAERSEVRARMEYRAELCTTGGILHGGALMALADSTGGMCAFLNLPEGANGTSTIESKTNFVRAVRSGFVEAVSRPLHTGRTVIVVDTEIFDADKRLVARVTQSQLVLGE